MGRAFHANSAGKNPADGHDVTPRAALSTSRGIHSAGSANNVSGRSDYSDRLERIAVSAHMIDWLGPRLADAVSLRLGAPVTFAHWLDDDGYDVPVFEVPDSHVERARELGIRIAERVASAGVDRAVRVAPENRS